MSLTLCLKITMAKNNRQIGEPLIRCVAAAQHRPANATRQRDHGETRRVAAQIRRVRVGQRAWPPHGRPSQDQYTLPRLDQARLHKVQEHARGHGRQSRR